MTVSPNDLPYALRGPSLNARQEAFCELYDDDPNAVAAARNAGYSTNSARFQGSKLLADNNIQQHIATLKKISARARALDRKLLLERLEELYHAAMAEGRLNAAIQALRLMAQIGGHTSRAAQEEYAEEYGEAELAEAQPLGPLQRAARQVKQERKAETDGSGLEPVADVGALVQGARQTLARTRPDPRPETPLRARLFMGTANVRAAGCGPAHGLARQRSPDGDATAG
jgi:phage terminase small subunit